MQAPSDESQVHDASAPPAAETHAPAPPPTPPERLDLPQWIGAGLRAAACLPARIGNAAPEPWQLFWLIAIVTATQVGLARLEVPGAATFHLAGWLYPFCTLGFVLFLVWACLGPARTPPAHPAPVPAWFAMWAVSGLPMGAVGVLLSALAVREQLPAWWLDGAWLAWLIYGLMWVWIMLVAWRVTAALTPSRSAQTAIIVGMLLIEAFASTYIDGRPWQPDYAEQESAESGAAPPALTLNQEVFADQQALLAETLAAITPRQAGRTNVFGLVYAPYAQSVFVRESAMVAGVLQERFGAEGHVVQLVNHPSVTDSIPWATNQNLRASLQALAARMDRQNDVLVVYLSSHGGADFKLATSHWPLEVAELTPQMLRSMLDEVGVRNRVLAVSACYAGGWIEPLTGDNTLVMTAADATHTSYGCGSRSELTFFGRALFDEQLRKTHSFEEAFAAAVPVIQQREIEGKKDDGFSNPQIAVGKDIRPVLRGLAQERQLLK
ncbi:MAG: C13 family peptidase [Pseudomonadota bacterium]